MFFLKNCRPWSCSSACLMVSLKHYKCKRQNITIRIDDSSRGDYVYSRRCTKQSDNVARFHDVHQLPRGSVHQSLLLDYSTLNSSSHHVALAYSWHIFSPVISCYSPKQYKTSNNNSTKVYYWGRFLLRNPVLPCLRALLKAIKVTWSYLPALCWFWNEAHWMKEMHIVYLPF